MTANPEHSTCPRWAAQEARRMALEEAAALCEERAAFWAGCFNITSADMRQMALRIRALIEAGK